MKKVNLILVAIATVCLFSTVSCEKETSNTPSVIGKATITGKALVNLNYINDVPSTTYDKVAAGTKIYAKINSKDLVLNPTNGNYADIIYTTTVDASGNYSFTIDANTKPVNVSIYSDDFRENLVVDATTTKSTIFTLDSYSETVRDGVSKILDLYFYEK